MMSDPRFAAWIVLSLAALAGCAHGIRKVSDCDQVTGEKRIACGACTVKNEAGGWIGDYEYRPDNPPENRCVRVK
jgi:hypothetical protein